jgi:cupin 2 domain-containing protein
MNIFNLPELPMLAELITILAESQNVRIERIISTGQVSTDWYDQEQREFVILLEGNAVVEFREAVLI